MAARVFLLGPTASGKTSLGVALAKELDAEILSLDSMLVYRDLNIATAKPTAAEQGGVPHHLMDLVSVDQGFSVAQYREAALAAEAEVRSRGKRVLYVGGTPMWLRALVHGLVEVPPVPQEIEQELQQQWASTNGPAQIRKALQQVDPEVAERIHPHDERRHIRALGTYRATGRSLGDWQGQWKPDQHALGELALCLDWQREALHARLTKRLSMMEDEGLFAEVQTLADNPGFGPTAAKAIGVSAVLRHFQGELACAEALAETLRATKTLVRRQATWLRRFPDLRRLEMQEEEAPSALLARAMSALATEL